MLFAACASAQQLKQARLVRVEHATAKGKEQAAEAAWAAKRAQVAAPSPPPAAAPPPPLVEAPSVVQGKKQQVLGRKLGTLPPPQHQQSSCENIQSPEWCATRVRANRCGGPETSRVCRKSCNRCTDEPTHSYATNKMRRGSNAARKSKPARLAHVPRRHCSASQPPVLGSSSMPLFVKWEEYVGRYLLSVANISFILVGANCGRNNKRCAAGGDPVWEYATQCAGWTGIVLEPTRVLFEELRTAYSPYPVQPLRLAVSDHAGVVSVEVKGEFTSLSSDEATAKPNTAHLKTTTTETVVVVTLAHIWPGSGFDILVVDAEGAEAKILCTPLPLPLPRLVLFEIAHMPAPQLAAINSSLVSQGYEHVRDLYHQDAAAIKYHMPPQDRLYGIPLG